MAYAVIISLYKNDNPQYYRQALDSIISQTVGKDKIRIYQAIDGEIPDELESVVSEYSQYFYKLVRISPNGGLANALNRLINELEDEEFVFRMDSDDIARSDRFEKQLAFFSNNQNVGVLGMAISEFDEEGKTTLRNYPAKHEELLSGIHKASPVAHPTVCFRRSTLAILKGYPTEFHLCEDIALWFKAIKKEIKFANLTDVGLDFRIQRNFFERRSISKAFAEFKVYWNGTRETFGFSTKLIYPIMRLISRLVPRAIIRILYKSNLRNRLLK